MQIQGYLSCARIWWELTDANLVSIDSFFLKLIWLLFCKEKQQFVYMQKWVWILDVICLFVFFSVNI